MLISPESTAKAPALWAFQGSLRQGSGEAGTENCTQHRHHAQPEVLIPGDTSHASAIKH